MTPTSLSPDYYRRVRDIVRPEWLADKKVLVIGCGSGGSRVAEEMVRTGIGGLDLMDVPGETLELHNIVRHPLGYRSLGKSKVHELTLHLQNLRPDADIRPIDLDVEYEPERFADYVADRAFDLLLLCTDNDPSRYVANEVATRLRVPMVFAGVFDGGVGGEVGRYHPDLWPACYGCTILHVGRAFQPRKAINIDYSNVKESTREARAASALNLDIATIANLHARMALYTLLHAEAPAMDDIPGSYVLFANRIGNGVFRRSLHADFFDLKPHPKCLLCSTAGAAAANDILLELPLAVGHATTCLPP